MSQSTRRHFKLALLTAISILSTGLQSQTQGQTIEWRTNLKKAAKESELYGKPVLLYMSADWCHFCRKMENDTFTDNSVKKKIASDLIAVSLDGEKHRTIARKYGVRGFPMSVVLDKNMKVLAKIRGYRRVPDFIGDLSEFKPDIDGKLSIYGKACPVEPLETGKFAIGSVDILATHRGYKLLFASEKNRDLFRADSKKYWPAMDGHCVVSALDDDEKRMGKLEFATIFEGSTWFFASKAKKEKFDLEAADYSKRLANRPKAEL